MMQRHHDEQNERDPLGLSALPPLRVPEDGWPAIESALGGERQRARRWRRVTALATAASAVLALLWIAAGPSNQPAMDPVAVATPDQPIASDQQEQALKQLIGMSQNLEVQLRGLRMGTGAIPASSAVYVAELEDLVAQVDNQISVSPDSINLWGQRVNLLLDLTQIYQHRWEREYGRMASL